MNIKSLIYLLLFILSLFIILKVIKKGNFKRRKIKYINKELERLKYLENKLFKSNEEIYEIARKYHQGIPETIYKNEIVKGMKPDFRKAIKYYYKLIHTEYHYNSIISLANIYNYEYIDDVEIIDRNAARSLYSEALKSPNIDIRNEAREKLLMFNDENGYPTLEMTDDNNIFFNDNDFNDTMGYGIIIETVPEEYHELPQQVDTTQPWNDTQNVHDTGVVKSVSNILDILKNKTRIVKRIEQCVNEMIEYIELSDHSTIIKTNAIKTLMKMNEVNSLIISCNCREKDLIELIWNFCDTLNPKDKDNLKYNIVIQLSEAIEFGDTVCAQGRFNHLIASLDILEEFQSCKIKPLWAIKQEMMNKSPKIIENVPEDRHAETLKNYFIKEYGSIVSEKFINSEIDSWYNV